MMDMEKEAKMEIKLSEYSEKMEQTKTRRN